MTLLELQGMHNDHCSNIAGKSGLHYQSFCDYSRNFAYVNSKF